MKPWCPILFLSLLLWGCAKRSEADRGQEPATKALTERQAPARAEPSEPPPGTLPSAEGPAPEQAREPGLVEVSGEELLLAVRGLGGKGTLVNAWASWCGPCRREMPMLLSLAEKLGPRGIELLLVSVDEPEARPQAVEFLKQHDAPLPSFVARQPLGPFKAALNPRWPGMLPATFLYDAEGRLRYFWGGPVYENELNEVLEQFLAGTLRDGEARFGLAPGKVER